MRSLWITAAAMTLVVAAVLMARSLAMVEDGRVSTDERPSTSSRAPRPIHSTPSPTPTPLAAARTDADEMVRHSLAFIAKNRNPDGSFGGQKTRSIRVALTSIACLAFLADGNTEFRGRYHREVTGAIKFLMKCSNGDDAKWPGYITANGDTLSRLHGHGYATLALTQAYGMFGTRRQYAGTSNDLKRVIRRAVDIIEEAQSEDGGWMYLPGRNTGNDEGSMTVCMLQALRGARNTGFAVRRQVITRAEAYLADSQNPDGSIRYQKRGDGAVSFELTAAGCASLIAAGNYYDARIRRARDYLWNLKFEEFIGTTPRTYPYYGSFYAVQALWFDYDDHRLSRMKRFYPRIVRWFRDRFDEKSGSFKGTSMSHMETKYGLTYRAAFAALTLQITRDSLPLFQR